MPLRIIAKYLASENLVNQLANTFVMRRLAQITHSAAMRASYMGRKSLEKLSEPLDEGGRANEPLLLHVIRRFALNIRNELDKQFPRK